MSNNNDTPPPWSEAPPWAMYRAQDGDGEWWWFKHEPTPSDMVDWWIGTDLIEEEERSRKNNPNPNWKTTLQKRPENE